MASTRGQKGVVHAIPQEEVPSRPAIDQASDAVDAARPVIENAVATVVEQVRDLSKDAAAGATVMAKETKTKAAPLIADGKVLAGEIAEATREVAIPKAKTAAAAGAASAAGLAASGKEYAAAKVADVKGEPPKRKGSKFRKLLFWGSPRGRRGLRLPEAAPQAGDRQLAVVLHPARVGRLDELDHQRHHGYASAAGGAHLAPGVGSDEPLATDDPMARLAAEGGATVTTRVAPTPPRPSPTRSTSPTTVTTPDDPADVVEVEDKGAKKK